MRTLRKVLCILCLAVLVTSSAAWAAPGESSSEGRSAVSWALSVLESFGFQTSTEEFGGAVDPNGLTSPTPQEATPQDPPTSPDNGADSGEEFGGAVDPNG